MAHSSSKRCQSLLERARRDASREKIAPTCPIATSLTRVLKSSRLVVSCPDWPRSPSRNPSQGGIGWSGLGAVSQNPLSRVRSEKNFRTLLGLSSVSRVLRENGSESNGEHDATVASGGFPNQ